MNVFVRHAPLHGVSNPSEKIVSLPLWNASSHSGAPCAGDVAQVTWYVPAAATCLAATTHCTALFGGRSTKFSMIENPLSGMAEWCRPVASPHHKAISVAGPVVITSPL